MIEFPIIGPYREVLLSLELTFLIIILEFSGYFFYKYRKNRKKLAASVVEFDWAILILSFGLMKIFYIIADFYYIPRRLTATFGYITIAIGGLIFLYHIERNKILNSKYIFTIFDICVVSLLIITFIIYPSITQMIAISSMGVAYIAVFLYFIKIIKKIWKNYKLQSLTLLFGIFFWLIGFSGASDYAIEIFNGLHIRVLGDITLIIGIILFGLSCNSIPSLAEFSWRDKLKYLLITNYSGICIYNYNFQEEEQMNEVLLGGALSGIRIFLEESMKKEGYLKVISKGSEVFLMDEGKNILGILVVEQELEILKSLLTQFVSQLEFYFSDILKNWTGQIEMFKPAEDLVSDIFSI